MEPMASSAQQNARRRRLTHRALPTVVALAAAVVIAVLLAFVGQSDAEQAAARLARAWERGDARGMHAALAPATRREVRRRAFARSYERAGAMSTGTSVLAGEPDEEGARVRLPVAVRTRAFGEVRGEVSLPVLEDGLGWTPEAVFPGLAPGERLSRRTDAPPRAAILAGDGRVLAAGPASARRVGLGRAGTSVAGAVGPAPSSEESEATFARGFPPGTAVGVSGLERILDRRLLGTPGGRLLAGRRTLAASRPRAAADVRTTIDPGVQEAAAGALGERFGGIAALDPRTGEIRALAGVAFSAPQPPGSTFKIVTATAGLEAGAVRPQSRFPVQTKAVIDGVDLENANGESCGGTFVESFAQSCNSVFAPLGVRVGARRLLATARRYGFGEAPPVRGAIESPLPGRDELGSPLALGSTAIGQGRLLTTPLRMASVAQTVAAGGRRLEPSVLPVAGRRASSVRVTSPEVAATLGRMMVEVVRDGTGERAALRGVRVAGKTGTAELEDTTSEAPGETSESDASDTDAWFTAFAPAREPRIAVAVMLVRAGAGGETAAPAARDVVKAGLKPAARRTR
ncbi:MAG: penicillin-binding protein 2 [Thermoleophilaceae bacterium]|nr:penicillin-binding protein 2 [Thermoleophilaceae bacterium]